MLSSIFFVTLILAYSAGIISYINSSFLETRLSTQYVGIVFTLAYLGAALFINYYAGIIRRYSNYRAFIAVLLIYSVCLSLLPFTEHVLGVTLLFVFYIVSLSLLWISLDIFMHGFSKYGNIGEIRGMNLTLMNLGIMLGPVTAGFLIARYGFSSVYLFSSFLAVMMVLFTWQNFRYMETKISEYSVDNISSFFKKIIRRVELRDIFVIAFLLQFFYSWMIIYTPIYLTSLGFSYSEIGIMFAIMLAPFVIFEIPAGYLADKYLGETEMVTLGLLIMAFSTVCVFFVSGFWSFTIVLFVSRVGASIVEIMRDSYFYKIIKDKDIELINLFRATGPVSRIIAPLIATVVIAFFPMRYLYLLLGIVMAGGIFFTLRMPDTK